MLPKISPLELGRADAPFDHPDVVFELKYDGWRALAYIDQGRVRLVSRRGNVYKRFDELGAALAKEVRGRFTV